MLTILCPASRRLDYLTLLAMGPGRRVHGDTFFCFFFFFWLALESSFFETLKRRGNTVKRSSQS